MATKPISTRERKLRLSRLEDINRNIRWLRSSPATIEAAAALEDKYQGEYFLTNRRRPLREVIDDWKFAAAMNPSMFTADNADFGCASGGICGV